MLPAFFLLKNRPSYPHQVNNLIHRLLYCRYGKKSSTYRIGIVHLDSDIRNDDFAALLRL